MQKSTSLRDLLTNRSLPVLLVDKFASARCGGYVASVNRVVAVGTPVHKRQTRAVVVSRMTLQAECGLAYGQKILVWRAVRLVTLHTVLIHRWVLVGERSLI